MKLLAFSRRNAMHARPETHLIDSELVEITSFALQVLECQQVIDRVTTIRAYAELSAMYPENARFRDEVLRSIGTLSTILEGYGKVEAAMRIRSWQAAIAIPGIMIGKNLQGGQHG
jgi:hypothetical protein